MVDAALTLHLAVISIGATLSFMLQVAIGCVLVWPMRILDKSSHISMMSQIVFNVLLPCMLFSKTARSISIDMLREYWMLLVFCVVYVLLGGVMGHVISAMEEAARQLASRRKRLAGGRRGAEEQQQHQFMYDGFTDDDDDDGNDSGRPHTYVVAGPSSIQQDGDDDPSLAYEGERGSISSSVRKVLNVFGRDVRQRTFIACMMFSNTASFPVVFVDAVVSMEFKDRPEARDLAAGFVSMFLVLPQVAMWSYGLWLLRKDEEEKRSGVHRQSIATERSPLLQDTLNASDDYELPMLESRPPLERAREKLDGIVFVLKKAVLTPPVIAVVAAICIGLFDSAKRFLILDPPPIISSFIYVSDMFGDAMVPCSLIVLGAGIGQTVMGSLTRKEQQCPADEDATDEDTIEKKKKSKFSLRKLWYQWSLPRLNTSGFLLAMSIVGKLLVMPAIALAMILLLVRFGLLPTNEPIFFLVLLIEAASPSSKSLSSISALNDNGHVDGMSEMLLAQYLISPITLCLGTIFFLSVSCTLAPTCHNHLL